jgi:hypothetical protein
VRQEFTQLLSGRGKPASWEVRPEPSAVSGKNVLAQTSYDEVENRFPLLVYNDVVARDVRVTVQFKPVSGKIDQTAGILVRFQDPDHFYVARANALEGTVQLYRVVNGARQVVNGAEVQIESGEWHSLEVTAMGAHFNETLSNAGKIGLSTKSDGVTIFDDLQITVLDQPGA